MSHNYPQSGCVSKPVACYGWTPLHLLGWCSLYVAMGFSTVGDWVDSNLPWEPRIAGSLWSDDCCSSIGSCCLLYSTLSVTVWVSHQSDCWERLHHRPGEWVVQLAMDWCVRRVWMLPIWCWWPCECLNYLACDRSEHQSLPQCPIKFNFQLGWSQDQG